MRNTQYAMRYAAQSGSHNTQYAIRNALRSPKWAAQYAIAFRNCTLARAPQTYSLKYAIRKTGTKYADQKYVAYAAWVMYAKYACTFFAYRNPWAP